MGYLLVTDNATGEGEMMTLSEAAKSTGIDEGEIASAIDTDGRCNSMNYLIIDSRPAVDVA